MVVLGMDLQTVQWHVNFDADTAQDNSSHARRLLKYEEIGHTHTEKLKQIANDSLLKTLKVQLLTYDMLNCVFQQCMAQLSLLSTFHFPLGSELYCPSSQLEGISPPSQLLSLDGTC